eukprot:10916-Pelagococcus_subviridis.AAC.2
MALNRWNTFFAEDVGLALSPIPMLLGFFTYKPASVFQAFRDVMEEEQKDGEGEDEWVVDESRPLLYMNPAVSITSTAAACAANLIDALSVSRPPGTLTSASSASLRPDSRKPL